MITFSQLGRHGAIGNQLFQYATLYSIGRVNGYEVKIPKTEEHFDDGTKRIQHYFLNCFKNISAQILNEDDLKTLKHKINSGVMNILLEDISPLETPSRIESNNTGLWGAPPC